MEKVTKEQKEFIRNHMSDTVLIVNDIIHLIDEELGKEISTHTEQLSLSMIAILKALQDVK